MKKIKFNFRNIQRQLNELSGYKVDVSGLHLAANKQNKEWRLFELRSGFIFLGAEKPGESLKSCIERAKERVERYGIIEINNNIIKALNEFGQANKIEDS